MRATYPPNPIVPDFITLMIYHLLINTESDSVTKSFRTGRLERELQMVQLSATKCNCVSIL